MKKFAIEQLALEEGFEEIRELRVLGYLDAHTVDSFEHTVEQLLSESTKRFILDLEEMDYISSAGIGALMVFLQQLRRSDGDMVLLRPSPKVFKVLDLLGFTQIFTIAYDRHTAREALK